MRLYADNRLIGALFVIFANNSVNFWLLKKKILRNFFKKRVKELPKNNFRQENIIDFLNIIV